MIRALDRFFFAPYPVHPLALCRILLGLALLHAYAVRGLEYGELLGADGLAQYIAQERWPVPASLTPWIYALQLLSTAAFTVGLLTPAAGIIVAATHVYFLKLVPMEYGWRHVIHAFVLYVALSGGGNAYALDRVWRRGRLEVARPMHASSWGARLIQFHVVAVYIAASYHRLDDYGWLHGQMVFEALTMSVWTRFPGVDFHPYRPLLEVASWWSWALELSAPFLLWVRRFGIRTFLVVNLMVMHACLELTSTIGCWQLMMIAGLLCFAPAEWSRRALEGGLHVIGVEEREVQQQHDRAERTDR